MTNAIQGRVWESAIDMAVRPEDAPALIALNQSGTIGSTLLIGDSSNLACRHNFSSAIKLARVSIKVTKDNTKPNPSHLALKVYTDTGGDADAGTLVATSNNTVPMDSFQDEYIVFDFEGQEIEAAQHWFVLEYVNASGIGPSPGENQVAVYIQTDLPTADYSLQEKVGSTWYPAAPGVGFTFKIEGFDLSYALDGVGLTYDLIQVTYRKYGENAATPWVISEDNWLELGGGLYALVLPGSLMDKLGEFWFEVTTVAENSGDARVAQTLSVWPAPASYVSQPEVCTVSGHIADLTGDTPYKTVTISFQLLTAPQTSAESFIAGRILRTTPDATGNFSVALTRGINVLVQIESVGIKQSFIVPDQETANLIDLLPPINVVP